MRCSATMSYLPPLRVTEDDGDYRAAMLPGCEKSLLFATEHIRQFFVLAVRTLVIRSSRVWRNAGGSCARFFCSHFKIFRVILKGRCHRLLSGGFSCEGAIASSKFCWVARRPCRPGSTSRWTVRMFLSPPSRRSSAVCHFLRRK